MNSKIRLLTILFVASTLFFVGCTKKEKPVETPDTTKVVTDTTKEVVDTTALKDTAKVDSTEAKKEISVVGTWQGKVANYTSTLRITNQNGNNFSGTIVVNYRNVATHSVIGSVNPETGAFSMSDNDQTRSAGNYNGSVAPNGRSISGSFTEKRAGGITVTFSFSK
jgi:hypothetical protein